MSYAEAAVYFHDVFHFQIMESFSSLKDMSLRAFNSIMNSSRSVSKLIALRFNIHLKLCSSLLTVLYLNRAYLYRLGGNILGEVSCNQFASQKGVSLSLPTVIRVEAKKNALSVLS
jgi:hypothetical protein